MRVFTKKSFRFVHPSGEKSVVTKALSFTELPDWVVKDPMYEWALADGDIEVIQSRSDELKAEKAVTQAPPVESEESVTEGADEDEDEDDGEETEVNLDEMDKDELMALAKEKGIKLTVKQKKTEASLRKAIAAALEEEDDEDED